MAQHKVDIIVPCYNYGHFVDECVERILAQTYQDYRVLLIDNASSDDTEALARAWAEKDERIRYERNPENLGFHGSISKAVSMTDAEYVVILPVDDYWEPGFLASTTQGLDAAPQAAMAYTSWSNVEWKDGDVVDVGRIQTPHARTGLVEDRDLLLTHNWIPLSFGLFRRRCFNEIGGIKDHYSQLGDYELWLQMAVRWPFFYVHQCLGHIRLHDQNWSRELIGSGKAGREYVQIAQAIFQDEAVWPVHSRYLAKAREVQRYLGEDLPVLARKMGEGIDPVVAGEFHDNRSDFYTAVAQVVLANSMTTYEDHVEFNQRSMFGSVADALKLLKDVVKAEPGHELAQRLLSEFGNNDADARYQSWVKLHALQEIDGEIYAERMMLKWRAQPCLHVVMFLLGNEQVLLADTLDSLNEQMYRNWRLSVISDLPVPSDVFEQFDELQWHQIQTDDDPYGIANAIIENTAADWVAFTWPGVQWEPQGLLKFADYADIQKNWRLIYADEDTIDPGGARFDSRFKPDCNLDLLRSMPYFGEFCLIRGDAWRELDGVRAFPGSENFDLSLRVLDAYGEQAIGHIPDVLVHMPKTSLRAFDSQVGKVVLKEHLTRCGVKADVGDGYLPDTYQVVYRHGSRPSATIVIPTRDKFEFFKPCIDGVLGKTDYENFEVIVVDNQSRDPDALAYYKELERDYPDKVRILRYPEKFNFSAISNLAAREARGHYLVFLNNDTEIVQGEWLSRMMQHAQRPEVGIVGPRLVYPESGRVQHVGVVLGLHGVAEHPYNNLLTIDEPGYMGRAQVAQNYSAVTGACLLIEKAIYEQVGGMDEALFAVSYNDIDLSLKVREAGYKVVWTPFSTLVHHSSITQASDFKDRGANLESHRRFQGERQAMLKKWMPQLASDPAYNRNLSLSHSDFRVDTQFPMNWDTNFHNRPRIFGFPLPSGAGDYRVTQPFMALSRAGMAQCEYARFPRNVSRVMSAVELKRMRPDVVVYHQTLNDEQLKALEQYTETNSEVFKVFTIDDLISHVPEKSSAYRGVMASFRDAKARIRQALACCDRFIASTQPLADLCSDMIDDIRVIPICLERDAWTTQVSKRRQGPKPRVGWAGAMQHQGDLEIIADVVKATADEIDWVFFGMCIDEIKPYAKELHDFVSIDDYPAKLASLNLDLAVAPLEFHPFNEAKSDLRLLEYGAMGWPVVCTDIYPYQQVPVTRVRNSVDEWIEVIRDKLSDMEALAEEGNRLRDWVFGNRVLEDRLDDWWEALMPNNAIDNYEKLVAGGP